MRISKPIPICLALIFGALGCSRSPENAYVDVSKIPVGKSAPPVAPIPRLAESAKAPPSGSLQGLPEAALYFAATQSALERARDTIKRNRNKALEEISARLKDAAYADIKRITEARIEALKPSETAALDALYAEARTIFLKFAFRAGEATFDLANIVGFPDPDPKSKRIPDSTDKIATVRFEKAKALRSTLDSLGRQFYAEFDSKLGTTIALNKAALADLKIEMNELLEQFLVEAQLEAERLTEQSTEDIASQNALREVKLSAEPGVTVSFSPFTSSVHQVVVPNIVLQRNLENELQIFAKVNGYELTSHPLGAKDVTAEFLNWRKQFNPGP